MDDTRRSLLEALEDGPVGGPRLAAALGVTRAAVWKHVEALRAEGFDVETTDDGYVVTDAPEFGGYAVEFGLGAPFEVEYHDGIGSTNDRARSLAGSGATDVVVLADRQTEGRGRLSRGWSSPSGGIWMSVVCRPAVSPSAVPLLTFAATVAVTEALRDEGVEAAIKWPNDVIVPGSENAKIAGVLAELDGEVDRVSWVVIGVGVNANVPPDELPPGATSALSERGPIDRRRFVQRVLETFDDLRDDPDTTLERWRGLSDTLGRPVRVVTSDGPIMGQAIDVSSEGGLVVDTDDGTVTTLTGDCEQLRTLSED